MQILGVLHIIVEKGVYSGMEEPTTPHIITKKGVGVDSGKVAYRCLKRGCIMRGRGRFWEHLIHMFKRWYILGARSTFWGGGGRL